MLSSVFDMVVPSIIALISAIFIIISFFLKVFSDFIHFSVLITLISKELNNFILIC